jgi:hypothetical protein
MPLNYVVPKPDHNSAPTEGLPRMPETNNRAVLSYPGQANSQSVLQLTIYPTTLKVSHLES